LRLDLVQEVVGIPDDRGDAKQRYVQVTLDRMIFLFFIQEKRLLDRNPEYLNEQSSEVIDAGGDVYDDFYEPLFSHISPKTTNQAQTSATSRTSTVAYSPSPQSKKNSATLNSAHRLRKRTRYSMRFWTSSVTGTGMSMND